MYTAPKLLHACSYYIIICICTHTYVFVNPFLPDIIFVYKDMPKRRNSAYYSQLTKQRLTNGNSDISTRISVVTNLHVDSPPVYVDATNVCMDSLQVIRYNFKACLH